MKIITVTKKHLDQAIKAREERIYSGISGLETCIISQAVKEQFPNTRVSTGFCYVYINNARYSLSDELMQLRELFDHDKIDTDNLPIKGKIYLDSENRQSYLRHHTF